MNLNGIIFQVFLSSGTIWSQQLPQRLIPFTFSPNATDRLEVGDSVTLKLSTPNGVAQNIQIVQRGAYTIDLNQMVSLFINNYNSNSNSFQSSVFNHNTTPSHNNHNTAPSHNNTPQGHNSGSNHNNIPQGHNKNDMSLDGGILNKVKLPNDDTNKQEMKEDNMMIQTEKQLCVLLYEMPKGEIEAEIFVPNLCVHLNSNTRAIIFIVDQGNVFGGAIQGYDLRNPSNSGDYKKKYITNSNIIQYNNCIKFNTSNTGTGAFKFMTHFELKSIDPDVKKYYQWKEHKAEEKKAKNEINKQKRKDKKECEEWKDEIAALQKIAAKKGKQLPLQFAISMCEKYNGNVDSIGCDDEFLRQAGILY